VIRTNSSLPCLFVGVCVCSSTIGALVSPGGRVYLEEKGHLETLSTQAGGRELNVLQEEPSAL